MTLFKYLDFFDWRITNRTSRVLIGGLPVYCHTKDSCLSSDYLLFVLDHLNHKLVS